MKEYHMDNWYFINPRRTDILRNVFDCLYHCREINKMKTLKRSLVFTVKEWIGKVHFRISTWDDNLISLNYSKKPLKSSSVFSTETVETQNTETKLLIFYFKWGCYDFATKLEEIFKGVRVHIWIDSSHCWPRNYS